MGTTHSVLRQLRILWFATALGIVHTHDWRAIVGLLAVGVLFLGSIRFLADYQPSYKWPDGHSIASLFVNLSGLILTLVAFSSPWLQL
jgi:hypothetical protein